MLLSIANFKGIMPKISPDLIGLTQAQISENCRIQDGELSPWYNYLFTSLCYQKGIIETIYLYENLYWFEWEADVDIVLAPVAGDTASKIYFTGDGIPKKTNLTEAITGSGRMPRNFYPLAVPTPKTALTSVSGAPPNGTGDDRDVNYVWTTVTSWGEEGFPSPVSANFTGKNGQSVDLSAMTMIWKTATVYAVNDVVFPVASEGGTYMYICVQAGTSGGSEPSWGTTVDGNTIDGTVLWRCFKNNLSTKRIYRLAVGDVSAKYNYVDAIAVSATTYTDEKEDADLGEACPTLNTDSGGQSDADYDPPPQGLQGISYMGNGMIIGFIGKDIYACIPYKPWAWPEAYVLSAADDIVDISPVGTGSSCIVTTTGPPYILTGTAPSGLTLNRLPEIKPNLSKRGTVRVNILSKSQLTTNYYSGVMYPSTDGLRFVNSEGMSMLLTQNAFAVDEWAEYYPATMHSVLHDNKYFGFYQSGDVEGGIIVDIITGEVTTLDFYCFAAYVDPKTDTLYFLRSPKMSVYEEILTNPDAPSTSGKATQFVLSAAGALAGIVQPDFARNLVFTITDANASLTAIQVTVKGTLSTGETGQTEVYTTKTAGSNVLNKAWVHIDSITVDSVAGGTSDDKLDVGWGVKFGLGNAIESSDDVFKTNMDDDDVAVSGHTISTTYSTITFATAPNATHDYQIFYTAV